MQIKTSKRGILTDASKLAERNATIVDAVRLLDLAGELIYENPSVAIDMINDVKSRDLKELEHIADTMGDFAEENLERMNEAPASAEVLKFEHPTEPKAPEQ